MLDAITTSSSGDAGVQQRQWWRESDREPHLAVMEIARRAMNDGRRKRYRALEALYAETVVRDEVASMLGIPADTWGRVPIARSAVDTLFNRLGKAKPKPEFLTTDGNWEAYQKAKKLTAWADGEFEALSVYTQGRLALKNAMVLGTGVVKTHGADGEPRVEIVWTGDVHVDPREERHNAVRTLYQTTPIDRGVLADMFPDEEVAIDKLPAWRDDEESDDQTRLLADDLVLVVEAWRLPAGRFTARANDGGGKVGKRSAGRHVIVVDGVTLADEPWTRRAFPFDFVHYRNIPRRFFGMGLVESIACMHADLQSLSETIGEAYDLMTPGVVAMEGSVPKKSWNNEVGKVITYVGNVPPQPWVPPAVSPDFLQREQALLQRCYELEGISQLSAQSVKPAGLNSGKALLVHQDVETERFALLAQDYEAFYVGIAKNLVFIAEEIVADPEMDHGDKLRVLGGRRTLEAISYQEARLEESEYLIRVWPVSALATSPQGRMEQVDLLRQLGVLTDPNEIRALLDFPDLDRTNSLALSGRDLADKMIANAINNKKFTAHAYMPLDYMLLRCAQERCLAELAGAPDAVLARVDALIGLVMTAKRKSAPPTPPAGGVTPPGPQGPAPMPPAMPAPIGMAA